MAARYWTTVTERGNSYSPFCGFLAILGVYFIFLGLQLINFPGSSFPISTVSAALLRAYNKTGQQKIFLVP